MELKQFDKIRLKTTRNIEYLVAPPNTMPNPHGVWSIVGNIGYELLVCKEGAMCKVPVSDVVPAGSSMANNLMESMCGKEKDQV